jgi:hypothetical protein
VADENTTETYTKEQVDEMVAGLKRNRDEALAEAKAARSLAKKYEGLDPEAAREALAQREEIERKKALEEGNLEAWKKQIADAAQKGVEAERKRAEKALAALEKRKVATLTEALAKAEAVPGFMDLLTLKGSASVRIRETDDGFEEYVCDAKGNELVADATGSPMSVEQFVQAVLKTQYPDAFKGTGSSGGGATKSTGGAGGAKRIASGDNAAFLANLDKIASGEVEVG